MKFDFLKKIFTPKVLTGIAVVGVVAVAVMSAKETPNAMKEWRYIPEEPVAEKDALKFCATKVARVAWEYKGTIIASGVTIVAIIGSHKLSMKQIAALTATCGYLASNRDMLEKEIRKLPGGEEVLKRVKKEVMEKHVEEATDKEPTFKKPWHYQSVEETGNGDLLCMEAWSGRLFRSSLDAVEQAQARFNDMRDEDGFDCQLTNGDYASYPAALSMNDLYAEYGLERTQLGHDFGWPADDDYYPTRRIDFENTLIRVDELEPISKARYNEDILVIEIGEDYHPMLSWQEL